MIAPIPPWKSSAQIASSALLEAEASAAARPWSSATAGITPSQYFSIIAIKREAKLPKSFASSDV